MKNEKAKHTPGPRCTKCQWVHEADSVAGTSFQGVGLCPEHAAAPELLAALETIHSILAGAMCNPTLIDRGFLIGIARAAIAKAKKEKPGHLPTDKYYFPNGVEIEGARCCCPQCWDARAAIAKATAK